MTDLTYGPTRSGRAHVCFIVDALTRMIVGWRVAADMRTDMVLEALENALAETTNGPYEAECVYRPDATGCGDVEHLELKCVAAPYSRQFRVSFELRCVAAPGPTSTKG